MIEWKYFLLCLRAAVTKIPQNLIMVIVTLIVCLILGIIIALIRFNRIPIIAPILDAVMAVGKAFPTNLVLLICITVYTYKFNDIISMMHLNMSIRDVNLIYIAIFGLIIVMLPGISEILRSGLIAIPKGQYEAGYAVGMTGFQTFRDIIFPQLFRVSIPTLTNSTLSLMKGTSLVSVMGVSDILRGATDAAQDAYCFLEAYVAAALVFWVIGIIIEKVGRTLEHHFSKSVKQIG